MLWEGNLLGMIIIPAVYLSTAVILRNLLHIFRWAGGGQGRYHRYISASRHFGHVIWGIPVLSQRRALATEGSRLNC